MADGDFIDLEWAEVGNPRLAILTHGLEGSADATYIQGMAGALFRRGWDILAWNLRGCGGEENRLPRFYHSGASDDLAAVVAHAIDCRPGVTIDLVGFSLGANLMLKYLGEDPSSLPHVIHRAVAYSVPCDLACSAMRLSSFGNSIYMRRFLRDLTGKVRAKAKRFPESINSGRLHGIRNFQAFDDRFTAPLHGFVDASDYWKRSSCRQFLSGIPVPVLLVNALNDPFLGENCYPREEAAASENLHLELPAQGGHVAFPLFGYRGEYWSERRAAEFLGASSLSTTERDFSLKEARQRKIHDSV